ncbi:MAG TPA: DUF3558 family protein [Pseudonocardiaceae bacterium]
MAPVLVAAAGVLAACGSGGNTGTTPTSASTASDTWYTAVKSCDMLDQSQLATLGFMGTGSVQENDSTQNSCEWTQSQLGSMGIVLASSTYSSLNGLGDPVTDVTIAGRPGKIAEDPSSVGGCDLAIEATSGSRAQIIVTVAGGSDKACSIAKQVAADIAPKLPSLSG